MHSPQTTAPLPFQARRLEAIDAARRSLLQDRLSSAHSLLAAWVERSWQRCLAWGMQPEQAATFQLLGDAQRRRTLEANAHLIQTARPLIDHLGRAIVNTGYFAILTNHEGVVVDASGAIDRSDARADVITRIGTDLSERSVGTTAIGSALTDLQPVWLHRGEHFFANTSVYSCAGAPVFGPDGRCVGMLDLTGIDAVERPELKHLVTQVAAKIENALVLATPHALTLRLNWPGNQLGTDADGILCLDADGLVTGANAAARQMVAGLHSAGPVHVGDLLGISVNHLFDAARRTLGPQELPLWSGLQLQLVALEKAFETSAAPLPSLRGRPRAVDTAAPLKDIETALIRQAVDQARGNVARAAQALGISRATVYRKLGRRDR